MSTIIMSQCWPLQGLSVTQKAVLISLADQANDDGVCWPAVGTIAARCCMSARAVRTAMDHLEAVGLLTRDRRFNSSTVYKVTPANFDKAAAPSKAGRKSGKAATAPGAGAAPHAGGAPAAGVDAPRAGGDAPGAGLGVRPVPPNRHITLNEPSGEPSFPAGLPAAPLAADSETDLQAACRATWAAYATAYRTRHGVAPVRNAKVNSNVRQIVQRLGHSEAPLVSPCAGAVLSRAGCGRPLRSTTLTGTTPTTPTATCSHCAGRAIARRRRGKTAGSAGTRTSIAEVSDQ